MLRTLLKAALLRFFTPPPDPIRELAALMSEINRRQADEHDRLVRVVERMHGDFMRHVEFLRVGTTRPQDPQPDDALTTSVLNPAKAGRETIGPVLSADEIDHANGGNHAAFGDNGRP